ncbi:hypothetical protein TNCV_491521 [Trichonephila clavipes]|nr:hypothetical protein TNCV_491521 [Trichonephila clavipes]
MFKPFRNLLSYLRIVDNVELATEPFLTFPGTLGTLNCYTSLHYFQTPSEALALPVLIWEDFPFFVFALCRVIPLSSTYRSAVSWSGNRQPYRGVATAVSIIPPRYRGPNMPKQKYRSVKGPHKELRRNYDIGSPQY